MTLLFIIIIMVFRVETGEEPEKILRSTYLWGSKIAYKICTLPNTKTDGNLIPFVKKKEERKGKKKWIALLIAPQTKLTSCILRTPEIFNVSLLD